MTNAIIETNPIRTRTSNFDWVVLVAMFSIAKKDNRAYRQKTAGKCQAHTFWYIQKYIYTVYTRDYTKYLLSVNVWYTALSNFRQKYTKTNSTTTFLKA